mmetsp:Transcript_24431/g.68485  ORF Transcript_24431/g.68485 Transcript_24431/m.68485 type:complete len:102 (-) Transcript_24431:286-591(-)
MYIARGRRDEMYRPNTSAWQHVPRVRVMDRCTYAPLGHWLLAPRSLFLCSIFDVRRARESEYRREGGTSRQPRSAQSKAINGDSEWWGDTGMSWHEDNAGW